MAKKKSKKPSSTAPGMFYGALSILVPAVVWGLVIFAETPAPPVSAGILLIVVAGIIVSYRKSGRA